MASGFRGLREPRNCAHSTSHDRQFKSGPPLTSPPLRIGNGQGGLYAQTPAQASRSRGVDGQKFPGPTGRFAAYGPFGFS